MIAKKEPTKTGKVMKTKWTFRNEQAWKYYFFLYQIQAAAGATGNLCPKNHGDLSRNRKVTLQ